MRNLTMTTAITVMYLSVSVASIPLAAEEKNMDHSQIDHRTMSHGEIKPGTEASGVGVVNTIDADQKKINITHEPMPSLNWPTMTMDLPVTKRVDLGGVKVGDKVDFTLKLGRDKQYRVIDMAPAK